MTNIRLYGRKISQPRIEVGVALDNKTDTLCFEIDAHENPYVASGCAVYCRTAIHLGQRRNRRTLPFAFALIGVPLMKTASGDQYPARAIFSKIQRKTDSMVSVWKR